MRTHSLARALRIEADHLETAGNILSGLGEHRLASNVWAVATRLRMRASEAAA